MNTILCLFLLATPLILAAKPTFPTSFTATGTMYFHKDGSKSVASFYITMQDHQAGYTHIFKSTNPALFPNMETITDCAEGWMSMAIPGMGCYYLCSATHCTPCSECHVDNELNQFIAMATEAGTCDVNGNTGVKYVYQASEMCVTDETILSFTSVDGQTNSTMIFDSYTGGADKTKFVDPGTCQCMGKFDEKIVSTLKRHPAKAFLLA